MVVIDELRLLVGLPLTNDEEREFGTTCVDTENTLSTKHTSERTNRLRLQQIAHDAGRLNLKGAGENFCVSPDEGGTHLSLSDEIRRIQRTKGIVWRRRKEAIAKVRAEYRANCRSAKERYSETYRSAKLAYARSVAGLLKVEEQARGVALDTYNSVTAQASTDLRADYARHLSARNQAWERIEAETLATIAMLDARIDELSVDILGLKLDKVYKRIDMGFLMMRKNTGSDAGLPLFAVFTPTVPDFEVAMHITKKERSNDYIEHVSCSRKSVRSWFRSAFSQTIRRHAETHLTRWGSDRYWYAVDLTVRITAKFAGVIPDSVRKRIHLAQPDFDEILIVSEAPLWEVKVEDRLLRPVPVGDPLVIGRKGKGFWLIDSFDTTSAEEYVRREFTSDRKK